MNNDKGARFISIVGRIAWLGLALFAFGLLIAGIPYQFQALQRGMVGVLLKPLPENPTQALITHVIPASPADQAGMQAGDVIEQVNGQPALDIQKRGNAGMRLRETTGPGGRLTLRGRDGRLRDIRLSFAAPARLPLGISPGLYAWLLVTSDVLFAAFHVLLAGLIVWRTREGGRAENFALLSATALVLIMLRIPPELALLAASDPQWRWLQFVMPLMGYFFIPLALALFPNGRLYPRWGWTYPLVCLAYGLLNVSLPGFLPFESNLLGVLADLLVTGLGLLAQFARYHKVSTKQEQQQTKWALLGILTGFVGFYFFSLIQQYGLSVLFFPSDVSTIEFGLIYNTIPRMGYLFMLAIPVSLSISILRFRLWDVDLWIRKTLVYALLTAMLAAVYGALVISLQSVFRLLTGQNSTLAIVASTLAITILFQPLRRGLQAFIDRRFYRSKYDAARTLDTFANTLRVEVDPERISGELLAVVESNLQPEQARVWMINIKNGNEAD